MSTFTVIMYHYVRPILNSRYSGIKGMEFENFKRQIHAVSKDYNIITMEQLLESYYYKTKLPDNAALLTFDDAYKDHFLYVFPILKKLSLQGSFFAPVKAVLEPSVLDVNKVHFILASLSDAELLVKDLKEYCLKYKNIFGLENFEDYYTKYAIANRWDGANVIFVKRMLQVALPEKLRNMICKELFLKYVGISEEAFNQELYLNKDQCEFMVAEGMHFGAHGYHHYWWNKLPSDVLSTELKNSKRFLQDIGISSDCFTACYPYGSYSPDVQESLKREQFKLAFTCESRIADVSKDSPYVIPRLDTNDIIFS